MNSPVPDADGPEIVTQESLLLGAVERVGKIREGRLGVVIFLSRLKPQNRQEGHIRIALRMLEPMVNAYRGQMFLFSNSDIVFLLKDPNELDVENMVYKLRALFSKDPLTFADAGDGQDRFCSWYDLGGNDYQAFLALAQDAAQEARQKNRSRGAARAVAQPMDAKGLDGILTRLQAMDVTGLVSRQAAMVLTDRQTAEVLFQEYYVSMAELQKALAPDVNLLANRWLFQHLSLTLDRQVLAALSRLALRRKPDQINLNLNIATVLGPDFKRFLKESAQGMRVAVEFQVLDMLADSRGYFAARAFLREQGAQVVVDGLNDLTLQFMEVEHFGADLYKLSWSPELKDGESGALQLASLDPEALLLARCDSEAAIAWGVERGLKRFQGRYVDAMLAAFTMAHCDHAAACTLQQCVARHGVISGGLRAACGNHDMLDSLPVMRAPKIRPRET